MLDAEQPGEFILVVLEGAASRRFLIEMPQSPAEQVEKLWRRVIGLGGEIEQLDEVSGEGDAGIVAAQVFSGVGKHGLPEGVEIAPGTATDGDLALVEEVEGAGKAAFWTQRALGDGLDFAMPRREPTDDQTRIAIPCFAE